jgi:hypothetical protein
MTPTVSLRKALADPQLLGGALPGDSWAAWRTILIAAMGEALTDEERVTFTKLTGRAREPLECVEEAAFVVGRRGGKSKANATLAVYIAGLCKHKLVRGERGVLLCIAPDQRQATIILDYATAAFEDSPILKQLIANRTADTLELTTGITIEVRAASFRRLRGPTFVAVIADEACFWMSDEFSANADVEILNAVRPGLATTRGPLIIASSPYAKRGVLWDLHRRHYGLAGDPLILVARGASRDFNSTLPQSVVDRALERDRAAANAEYLGQFRTDIESFVAYEVVQGCVGDHVEMAPQSGVAYHGFVDPSGGSADSFTTAVAHADDDGHIIIDAIREAHPPFSPAGVIEEFAGLLKSYRVARVMGDHYAGQFPRELFRKCGIEYRCADRAKSDLYRDLLPLLNSGRIVLPKSDRLVNQLCGLERRVARSGKDSIDHGQGMHDDLCNAVAGVAATVSKPKRDLIPHGMGGKVFSSSGSVISDSVSYVFDRMKPKSVPTTNDEIFAAGLKAQHEAMKLRVEGAPRPPTRLENLPADAQARLRKFRAELDAKARGIGNLHGKLFYGGSYR